MKVAVFGGAGFIGSHVCENLIKRNIKPIVFDRFKRDEYIGDIPVDVFLGDIKDREAVDYLIAQVDGAINLAGILGTAETVDDPFPSAEVNILGALNFMQACRKHDKRGVQIAVGNHFMNNSYSITKTTAERFALMFNHEHDTKIAVVRALNAYGERQKHKPIRKIIPNFIVRALKGEAIEVYGDGKQIMDMIYVKDVAEILVRALLNDHGVYDKIFEAGTGRKTTVLDIARMVNDISNNEADIKHLPMRAGEPDRSIVIGDPVTLKPLFKFVSLTSLEKGLQKTFSWYDENYEL